MSRQNTLEGKRLRRIARRAHKEKSGVEFNLKLHAAFRRKYPKGRPFMTDEGLKLFNATVPPRSPIIVSRSDVRRHSYLSFHGLPHHQRVAALAG